MASNQRQTFNEDDNLGHSLNPNINRTQSALVPTGKDMGRPTVEVNYLNQTNDILLQQQIDGDIPLYAVSNEYDIPPDMAEHLLKLRNFELAIVCDDSGSMMTPVDGTQRTRWDELCSIVKIVVNIGVKYDSNGVDIYFLNRTSCLKNVKDPGIIDLVFKTPPSGYTPLVPVLNKIFQSELARPGRDKKLLVFVATDGEPTDDNGDKTVDELECLMRETRQVDTTHVSFLLCTDDPAVVKYMREWDQTMSHIDVTDDFKTQAKKVRECSGDNYRFSYGDYVVKALVGAIVRSVDLSDERH